MNIKKTTNKFITETPSAFNQKTQLRSISSLNIVFLLFYGRRHGGNGVNYIPSFAGQKARQWHSIINSIRPTNAKHLIVLFTILLINHFCMGQNNSKKIKMAQQIKSSPIRSLVIGDPVPEIVLSNVRNYKSNKITLSDFKGKLIILDFWSKNCGSCIKGFPKMDKLQQKYHDKIQILLVTYNSYEQLKPLFQKSENIKSTRLPIVLSDTILHKLFPNEGLPYYVWIDGAGRTVAKITPIYMTESYIDRALNGERLPQKIMKEETLMDFDSQAPMIVEGGGRQWNHLAYYSMIMKNVPNIQKAVSGPIQDPITKKYVEGSYYATNIPMISLYRGAYEVEMSTPVIIESENAIQYYQPRNPDDYLEWLNRYSFCYEQILPAEKKKFSNLFLQKDLEQFFGLTGVKENKIKQCFVLHRLDTMDRLKSKYSFGMIDRNNDSLNHVLKYRFSKIKYIIDIMIRDHKLEFNQPILIDETGYLGDIDIHFTADISNLDKLRNEISKFGLGIKIEERTIECLVLKKNLFWAFPGNK